MALDVPLLREIGELTSEWLGQALGRAVGGFEVERIGTGQMSLSYRVTLDGGDSVVVKVAATDPTSRATGLGLGIYEREVRFYRELAPLIGGPIVGCHAAAIDSTGEWFTLVLEDVAPAVQGDQIAGCSVEQARLALRALAQLHAPLLADPGQADTAWLVRESPLDQSLMGQLLPAFLERYEGRVSAQHREVCERLVASLDGFNAERPGPQGLVHGDYRLDNMLFGTGAGPRDFAIVDWQTVGWGTAMTDASYFLGSGLTTEDRRAHERELLREYHEGLLAAGVTSLDWETCWEGYRRQAFVGILMVVAPAMIVERTERGDEMFLTSLERFAQQAIDLDAADLLPPAGSGRPAPQRPDPVDEGPHDPGGEELWNESWYLDAISEDETLGVWVRLGLYPNLGVSWVTAFVCRPGHPTAAVIDFAAPLPEPGGLAVATDRLECALDCAAPLERYGVTLDGAGEQHADAAAWLRGEPGEPMPVGLDLVWTTLGEPYAYRMATRYEIPCRVTGHVRVGDERLELRGIGQRDHSWGPRDWWAAEWMWSSGHLDDGTSFHGVEFRLPDAPRLGVGYVQPPDGGISELERVAASEEVGPDGLITSARVEYGDGLTLTVEPLAFGPLRLVAPDGRTTSFPRAMCRVTAADGRRGVAWLEWNLNRSL